MVEVDRSGFNCSFLPPDACECLTCGLTQPLERCGDWPRLVNVPDYVRQPGVPAIATGLCPACGQREQTANVPEMPEPERMLFA